MDNRRAIHAYVSDVAYDAWQDFASANGVSVTALIETVGLQLAEEPEEAQDPGRKGWIKAARKVDGERRRRTYVPKRKR